MTIKQNGGVFGRNPTFNDVDVEGDLTVSGVVNINDINIIGDVDVTGTVTADGLTVDGDSVTANAQNALTLEFTAATGVISADRTGGNYANLQLKTTDGSAPKLRQAIDYNGDISFYEATGTTPKFFWNASLERLGIGTSPDFPLHVSSTGVVLGLNATSGAVSQRFNENGTARFFLSTLNGSNGLAFVNGDGTSERMRIDSSGNVGIGTSSPSNYTGANAKNLVVGTNSGNNGITIVAGVTGYSSFAFADSAGTGTTADYSGLIQYYHATNNMNFFTTGTPRMSIDSSGNLLVGKTSSSSTVVGTALCSFGRTDMITSGGVCSVMNRQTSTGTIIEFQYADGVIGTISTDGSSTAYNTSSDYRLKTDAQPMTGASARVQALKPVNFEWIADGTRVDGFLAHEAQEVVPEAVTGTKDAVDADGNPEYQGIDQSKLVPLLTAALQEALTKIDALETRITALEG
jgi:hypothetical protein